VSTQIAEKPTTQGHSMSPVTVTPRGGDQFEIGVRGHHLLVDQPLSDGGMDEAPTPTELFVASLASCVAFYANRYLTRHRLPTEGLSVDAHYSMASRPARVSEIRIDLAIPAGVPEDRREALLAVASHCTVHNTLVSEPDVAIALTEALPAVTSVTTG
jgi:putative redox protein